MTWNDITVFQYQALERLTAEKDVPEYDQAVKLTAILHNKTEREIDSMAYADYLELLKATDFMQEAIPEPVHAEYIEVEDRRYRCIYDVREIRAARYIEAKTFSRESVVQGLHQIAASMVIPQVRKGKGWEDAPYDAARHPDYATDMLQAKFVNVYGSVVFFCNVFVKSMDNLQPYLTKEMMKTGKSAKEVRDTLNSLTSIMAGFTKPLSLQSMSA